MESRRRLGVHMTSRPDALERVLLDLSDAIDTPPVSETLLARVKESIANEPIPTVSRLKVSTARAGLWAKSRLRWLLAVVAAFLMVGIAVSPVGADIAEWFGFHGVIVVENDNAPTGDATVPPADGKLTLTEAAEQVGFHPMVPELLESPDDVSADPKRHLVSMSWDVNEGTIRLDQFEATLSPLFWKASRTAEPVTLNAGDGLWFPEPHKVVILGPDGEITVPARLAATTLIWPLGSRTLRLEGEFTQAQAIAIANSVAE